MSNTWTIEKCQHEIAKIGLECLSKEYFGNSYNLKLKCKEGHSFERNLKGLLNGHTNCPECIKNDFLKRANDIALKHDGKCLSEEYQHSQSKMLWKCKSGHEFFATFANIQGGQWCPKCRNIRVGIANSKRQKYSILTAHDKAKQFGGECLSTAYVNANGKLKWKCRNGHVFEKSLWSVNAGKWCPTCAWKAGATVANGKRKKSEKDFIAVASCNGGFCLDWSGYETNKSSLLWKCKKGHKFYMSYNNVQRGQWCPKCKIKKHQNRLRIIIEDIINEDAISNFRGFPWQYIKKSKRKFEIDIWFPKSKIAVEYDGEQHFMPVVFGGMTEDAAKIKLKRTKAIDKVKTKRIKENPNDVKHFIRFSYREVITRDYVIAKLCANGVAI